MGAKCPLFHNPKVLCRIKPESGHKWSDEATRLIYSSNYCESRYYPDCEDFAAYAEQQAIIKGKILVVDDEEKLVETLSSFLTSRGYETMTATSAEQALELLKVDQPALAIVDVHLPGMNGLEFVKLLRQQYPDVRVFIATGYDEQYKEAADALKVDAFFAKPLALEQLKQETIRVLAPAERRLQQALEAAQPVEGTAKAKLLFFLEAFPNEEHPSYARWLEEQFRNPETCEGEYQLNFAYTINEALEQLMSFRPDMVLIHFDSLNKLSCGQLCARIQQSPYKPKELIVFGLLASYNKREVEELGARYVDQQRFSKLVRAVKHTALRLQNQTGAQGNSA